ncbi:cellulase family glycosylhydrolase [Moorena producens JHB]|uniref:cellulase n=1 Tax=Moorena producens (strain JHB) TaxID=1454205 RepID=A0A9Q9SU85_MOOP1|nr:cellulase family glycosylhydrolase [Moorena producens]WAN69728.1 cellulase family glycosylhydrolase [Moorena producens JHB]
MSRFFRHISRVARILSTILLTIISHFGQPRRRKPGHSRLPKYQRTKFRLPWRIIALGLALVFLSLMELTLPSHHPVDAANAARTMQLPLSTQGSQLLDSLGRPILLRGVNWFGIETDLHAPHGLWKRDYKDMLAQIKSLGYNMIRLPFSIQSLRASEVSGIDFNIGSNRELYGKSPLEVMDAIIKEAQQQGILILLDCHQLNDQRIPPLWYGDGFTETDWIETWKILANRYRNQPNVIGADLKNEPHGPASWGTNDLATDWRLAAQRAGNAILAVNPNWLIVVEGVEKNVPGQRLATHWHGGNLEGVREYPVRLSNANKLVYSPHEYGPGVFNHSWFSEPSFPNNLEYRWEIAWNYIAREGIAPILIGEFGGKEVDPNSTEGVWKRRLVNYINRNNLSFAYWSWNPNSGDTGGILQDDWQSVEAPKQQLLQGLLIANNFAPNVGVAPIIPSISIPRPSFPPGITKPMPTPLPNSQPRSIGQMPIPTPSRQPSRSVAPLPPPLSNSTPRSVAPLPPPNLLTNPGVIPPLPAPLQSSNPGVTPPLPAPNLRVTPTQVTPLPLPSPLANPGLKEPLPLPSPSATPRDRAPLPSPPPDTNQALREPRPTPETSPNLPNPNLSTRSQTRNRVSLKVVPNLHSDWQEGFCIGIQVINEGSTKVEDWELTFQMNQAAINNSWNANFQPRNRENSQSSKDYVVTPLDWGRLIEPGQSRHLGFCANKLGSDYKPKQMLASGH